MLSALILIYYQATHQFSICANNFESKMLRVWTGGDSNWLVVKTTDKTDLIAR